MSSPTATLRFQTQFHSAELNALELPIEVRSSDMRLVSRTLTTSELAVEPGDYYITTRLPAGQTIQVYVEVKERKEYIVSIRPDAGDESPSESLEVQHFLRGSLTTSPVSMASVDWGDAATGSRPGPAWRGKDFLYSSRGGQKISLERCLSRDSRDPAMPSRLRLRLFAGSPLERTETVWESAEMPGPDQPQAVDIPLTAFAGERALTCQIQQAGRQPTNRRLPIASNVVPPEITLLIPQPPLFPVYRIGIRIAHKSADLLTRYLGRGMYAEAQEASLSHSMDAENLLSAKQSDPIAAAVGAYTLLRVGQLERLHEWTENLMNWFEWLPDGAAIRGEHLARQGKHLESLRAFIALSVRGLPVFTDGLSYTVERLRLYTHQRMIPEGATAMEIALATHLRDQLTQFSACADFDRTYLTYPGADPASPNIDRSSSDGPPKPSVQDTSISTGTSIESIRMTDETPSEGEFFFNGINGATGEYLESPKSARQIADLALSDPAFPSNRRSQAPDARHLRELSYRAKMGAIETFGARFGVAPDSVDQAGWGVIFAQNAEPQTIQALRPLLELRKSQAGEFYKEYRGNDGYAADESKDEFLTRHGMGPGPADPTKVPYYLLIVGDPQTIPYRFQYQLDVQYAVGRIWFDVIDDYAQYAQSVVAAESGKLSLPRQAVFFGPRNNGDRATALSADQLLEPLSQRARERGSDGKWTVETVIAADATRPRLIQLLGGEQTPALLFTASHGMGFPVGDRRQLPHQGALLCQDWPGPGTGAVDRGHYFAAEDISDSAQVAGLISFHFACYGAGTPRLDDFAHQAFRTPTAIAPHPFLAALPRRLLSHPAGSALAVIGHVERAWGCSIVWADAGRQIQGFEDAIDVLMQGLPVGYALESINQRYADLSSSLGAELLHVREGRKQADEYALATQWTANNDARSYVIIGDPAVRLPLAPAGSPGSPRAEFTPVIIPSEPTSGPIAAGELSRQEQQTESQQRRTPPMAAEATEPAPSSLAGQSAPAADAAELNITLPLHLRLSVSLGPHTIAVPDGSSFNRDAAVQDAFAVEIDPDYDSREGYDSGFLGGGSRRVPLPQLTTAQLTDAAKVSGADGDDDIELRYHHYSVVLNGKRKLAYFTAVNIDGELAKRPRRERDRWVLDPRVPESMQVGEDLYKANDLDRGHLVRRLDPAWGRTTKFAKRANDDTFHFTNCSPQHARFNQGQNLWLGLEDYLLQKATNEERRLTVFTGPIFTASDPIYRGIPIPKRYWKVAVVARPNNQLASLGFIVDQEDLLRRVVAFGAQDVAKTFQVPVERIEQLTELNFGRLAEADAGSVASFAIGQPPERELTSFDQIVLPKTTPSVPGNSYAPSTVTDAQPPETVAGSDLRYFLVAYDSGGRERDDHPAGRISRLLTAAVADPTVTDVIVMCHGWKGDIPSARSQYSAWIQAMSGNQVDRENMRKVRPGFRPVLVGLHWPSQPWGDERFGPEAFGVEAGEPSLAATLEDYAKRLGDMPEARQRVLAPLRRVLELTSSAQQAEVHELSPELAEAYLQLDAAVGLGARGIPGSPSDDREPFDPRAIFEESREALQTTTPGGEIAFGTGSTRDRLLSPLRALSYWKMKDRARNIGEGAVHQLLARLQQTTTGRDVKFHLIGHSFGTIVVSCAAAGPSGSPALPRPIDALVLLQGAVSLWSYCADIPYSPGTAGYFHRLLAESRVRGPVITTRSTSDTAVGNWYPLASRVSRSVAFETPGEYPKYGGIGSFGIQGPGIQIKDTPMLAIADAYDLGAGAVTNVDASQVIRHHSDITRQQVAHLVWSAIAGARE